MDLFHIISISSKARYAFSSLVIVMLMILSFSSSTSHFILFSTAVVATPVTLPVVSICTGSFFGCAAFNNNKFKCWGNEDSWGRVYGDYSDKIVDNTDNIGANLSYVPVSDGNALIQELSCGNMHVCVRFGSGSLKCVGRNNYGQAGVGLSATSVGEASGHVGDNVLAAILGNGLEALSVTLGRLHTCVKVTGDKVKCFGRNDYGQLGQGNLIDIGTSSSELGDNLPVLNLGTNVEVDSIHSGTTADHNCVILSKPISDAQKIKCWGNNNRYQLGYFDTDNHGDNPSEMGDSLPLVDLGAESRVKQLAIGSEYTCALLTYDALKCFGYDSYDSLESGSTLEISAGVSLPSAAIDSGKTIKLVSAGHLHTCIVYDDQTTMKCVGWNGFGQLGQGDTLNRGDTFATMISITPAIDLGTGSTKISSVHCGKSFTCVILENSLIKCWGRNKFGQLGIDSTSDIGDEPGEMGTNLKYIQMFAPTQSPTTSPTKSPTFPTNTPSKSPTRGPTRAPSNNPTQSPTNPTKSPTQTPTATPTTSPSIAPTATPAVAPTTHTPTTIAPATTTSPVGSTQTSLPQSSIIGLAVGIPLGVATAFSLVYFWKKSRSNR